MIKGRALLVALGMLTLVGAGLARAEDEPTEEGPQRTGWYVTAQGVRGFELFHSLGGLEGKDAMGFKGRIGNRFMPMLAAEGEIEWDEFGLAVPAGTGAVIGGGETIADLSYHVFTLNLRAYPLAEVTDIMSGNLEPFVVGGIGFANANLTSNFGDDTATRFAVRAGAGLEYHVTDHFSVVADAEYVASTVELKNLTYLSVGWGVQWLF